jgi:hypothetical protein
MTDYKFHDAANIFPMDDEHLPELAEDIGKHGQQVAIELCGGLIIDGRRRYTACKLAGVDPYFTEVNPADPVAYVLSLNLHRRHLTPSQLSMVGARAREIHDKAAKDRQRASGGDRKSKESKSVVENLPQPIQEKARDAVGKAIGVSGKSIDHATRVIKQAIPEVVKAVDEGRMAVSTAAILATEPADVQLAEVTNPKRNRTYKHPKPEQEGDEGGNSKPEPTAVDGVKSQGVRQANAAIDCLMKIPANDPQRRRALEMVSDWIKTNKRG